MRRLIIIGAIALAVALLAPQIATAQGTTTFLSNLGQTPTGSNPVGSDSWLAAGFFTGNNAEGYVLNSIQLGMADDSGNPSGFTVMVYAQSSSPSAVLPGSSLGTLIGSTDPANSGTYTYTAPSDLSLSPNTPYFIVITAGTTVANGAFEWSFTSTFSYQPADSWAASVTYSSINGSQSSWGRLGSNPNYDYSLFALNATPAPEPGVIGLFALGGLLVGFQRWKTRAV
jgi:hypothetical protein